jgi:hypothetical protein
MANEESINPETTVVRVPGYQAFPDQRKPSAVIYIDGEIPCDDPRVNSASINSSSGLKDWKTLSAEKFGGDARQIFDALANNLPGGTMHQLLILMLQRELNLHIVKD